MRFYDRIGFKVLSDGPDAESGRAYGAFAMERPTAVRPKLALETLRRDPARVELEVDHRWSTRTKRVHERRLELRRPA